MVLYRHSALGAYRPTPSGISPLLDIAQGAGLAGAVGVRPFLPPILAGALGRADVGVDFEATPFAFLESPAFLVAVLALAVASYAAARVRGGGDRAAGEEQTTRADAATPARDPVVLATGAVTVVLGGLLFAASLTAAGLKAWPGLVAGAALALAAYAAASGVLSRARRRLDAGAAALLPVWADAVALAVALAAILFPPAALVALLGLAYLSVAARRERGRRYEGLRVLR